MTQATQQTYLVPLDGSQLAESVLPAVCYLAGKSHARVILLHVIEQRPPAQVHGERHLTGVTEANAYLEALAEQLRTKSINVESHVHEDREQSVARSIVDHADELQANMIIMCAHGNGGLRDFLFGSIAQQALQRGTRPILLILPDEKGNTPAFGLQHILVPLDGTPSHEASLPVALELSRITGAQLHLVLVIPTLSTLSGEQAVSGMLMPTTMRAVLDLAQQGANDYLKNVMARCEMQGVKATAEVLRGNAAPVLQNLSERLQIDLVVLATHGKAGITALLSGSVAARITGRVQRPLLLIRAGETAEA